MYVDIREAGKEKTGTVPAGDAGGGDGGDNTAVNGHVHSAAIGQAQGFQFEIHGRSFHSVRPRMATSFLPS